MMEPCSFDITERLTEPTVLGGVAAVDLCGDRRADGPSTGSRTELIGTSRGRA